MRSELKDTREETMAYQEKTEARLEGEEPTSVDMEPEVPREDDEMMPVGEPRKRRRDRNLAAGRRKKPKETTRESVDPGSDLPSPAERRPTVRKWHGRRKTLLGETAPGPWLSEKPRQ
jgi:hypothetical protein